MTALVGIPPIIAKRDEWVEVHYRNEGMMAYAMHLHGLDQLVIAKDGFLLDSPYLADTINVAPGERYTVLVTRPSPASGPGTATFSPTRRVGPACSAWSPRWS